jgi:hypothetical protein
VYASCLASITWQSPISRTRALTHSGHATEGLHAQVVSAHAVPNDHVERCRRRPFFIEASHVEALRIGPPVHELMDRALVAVKGEDHLGVAPEEVNEGRLVHAVGMGHRLEQGHQVHDVDHPHLQFRHVLPQPPGRGHHLQGRMSPAAASTMSGSWPRSFDAHCQTDAPRAQCWTASSMLSHWSEGSAEGVDQNVAELATLVNRPGRGHAHVARDPAGRVPSPPVGVKPIVVSRGCPSRIAASLAPFPRCAMISRPTPANPSASRTYS